MLAAIALPFIGGMMLSGTMKDFDKAVEGREELEARPHGIELPLRARDYLLQPYLDSVEKRGEVSLVLVDGEPSHAVLRLPRHDGFVAAGDQDGIIEVHEISARESEIARARPWGAPPLKPDTVRSRQSANRFPAAPCALRLPTSSWS